MTSYAGVELTKDAAYTIVSPEVPAVPAVPDVAFRMYATPPPLGYTYRQLSGGRPNDLSSFLGWSQLVVAPTLFTQAIAGYEYKTLAQLTGQSIPSGAVPVYEVIGNFSQLSGYSIPIFRSEPMPPQFWGAILNMEYVRFLDAPAYASNGYPIGPGPYTGEFFVPTLSGLQRVVRTYVKDGRGVWMPTSTSNNPPYCRSEGSCRVTALIGFPGRAAVAAQPEIRVRDARLGWNSGANSISALDGDIRLTFPVRLTNAAAVGWANNRGDVTSFTNLSHAFYFDTDPNDGILRVSVIESGRRRLIIGTAVTGDTYELRRIAGSVSYRVNGTTVYSSSSYSGGAVRVGAALYAGEDSVGDGMVFENVAGGASTTPLAPSSGYHEIVFHGFGFGPSIADLGGIGLSTIEVFQADSALIGNIPVQAALGYGELSIVSGYSFGSGSYPDANGQSEIFLTGFAYEAGNLGLGVIEFVGFGLGDAAPPQIVFDDTEALVGGVGIEFDTRAKEIAAMQAVILAAMPVKHRANGLNRITDQVLINDVIAQVFRQLIAAEFSANASSLQTFIGIERAAEALVCSGLILAEAEAIEVVLAALALMDDGVSSVVNTTSDALDVVSLGKVTATAIGQMIDAIALGLNSAATASIGIVLADKIAIENTTLSVAEAFNTMRSGVQCALRFTIDNGEYVAWVMNTESKGLSRYTNYPFNSFMKVGGRYYGATDTGLYALEGEDDAGEDINVAMRLGLNAYGTQRYKRMPTFYVGFRSDGDLLLKAVVSDVVDGERVAHSYRLRSTNAQNMRDGRRPIGRGLEAVYWDFVIENIDGADIEIDVIEMLPMVLTRRVRGDSGGKG